MLWIDGYKTLQFLPQRCAVDSSLMESPDELLTILVGCSKLQKSLVGQTEGVKTVGLVASLVSTCALACMNIISGLWIHSTNSNLHSCIVNMLS